mmetsp:Transcript_29304/g.47304  ORF Transcript_29304/g.47304 Transcript_29304/m.47304 type:complete len:217 (+) Transcript_29304:2839-3489(+)
MFKGISTMASEVLVGSTVNRACVRKPSIARAKNDDSTTATFPKTAPLHFASGLSTASTTVYSKDMFSRRLAMGNRILNSASPEMGTSCTLPEACVHNSEPLTCTICESLTPNARSNSIGPTRTLSRPNALVTLRRSTWPVAPELFCPSAPSMSASETVDGNIPWDPEGCCIRDEALNVRVKFKLSRPTKRYISAGVVLKAGKKVLMASGMLNCSLS